MTIEQLKNTEEYKTGYFTIVKCPICGKHTLDMFYICPECGWEYDGAYIPNHYSSANECSVAEYRNKYFYNTNETIPNNPEYGLDIGIQRGTEKLVPIEDN